MYVYVSSVTIRASMPCDAFKSLHDDRDVGHEVVTSTFDDLHAAIGHLPFHPQHTADIHPVIFLTVPDVDGMLDIGKNESPGTLRRAA